MQNKAQSKKTIEQEEEFLAQFLFKAIVFCQSIFKAQIWRAEYSE